MKLFKRQKNNGFTIIEALVAISILSISVAGMLGVTASTFAAARYANNEIAANYLLQEAVDSVRNSRDTIAFQKKDDVGFGWAGFLNRYGYSGSSKCFSSQGCYLKMENFNSQDVSGGDVYSCDVSSGCLPLSYDSSGDSHYFYYYDTGTTKLSSFKRTVIMSVDPLSMSRSLEIYLLNWQK
jgi:prepilin-type N-terminal cleavage/methylation domain-containing protein